MQEQAFLIIYDSLSRNRKLMNLRWRSVSGSLFLVSSTSVLYFAIEVNGIIFIDRVPHAGIIISQFLGTDLKCLSYSHLHLLLILLELCLALCYRFSRGDKIEQENPFIWRRHSTGIAEEATCSGCWFHLQMEELNVSTLFWNSNKNPLLIGLFQWWPHKMWWNF